MSILYSIRQSVSDDTISLIAPKLCPALTEPPCLPIIIFSLQYIIRGSDGQFYEQTERHSGKGLMGFGRFGAEDLQSRHSPFLSPPNRSENSLPLVMQHVPCQELPSRCVKNIVVSGKNPRPVGSLPCGSYRDVKDRGEE